MGRSAGKDIWHARQEAVIPLLLDTCALIWLAEDAPLAIPARDAIASAVAGQQPLYISPISGWEIGWLIAGQRLNLPMPAEAWFERVLANPRMGLTELSLGILLSSSFLPGAPPRDPADRILIATARQHGFCLMTRDKKLLHYAEQGHVLALAC
jgi:PIN domain nuclease of toxin-antitoxin system